MTAKQDYSFLVTKTWYIVKQENRFVLSHSTNNAYAPFSSNDIHYNDTLTAQIPALAYGNAAGKIEFAIDFTPFGSVTPVTIKERGALGTSGANTIGYYFNSSMPAGTYSLSLYGAEVTAADASGSSKTYPAISGSYSFTVLPKAFDAGAVAALHAQMQRRVVEENGVSRTTNEYPLTGAGKMLHEPIATQEAALNATLNLLAPSAGADNYWAADYNSANPNYFDKKVTIGYNLEGSGNYDYYSYANMLGQLTSALEYTLYYSISAKNYVIVGGANAEDRQDRGFKTILYTDVKVAEFYEQLLNPLSPFFQNVVYTGGTVHTVVPSSQYYSYDFTDNDYVNARSKATVTLTLYDADLARWNTLLPTSGTGRVFTQDEVDDAPNHYVLSADGKSLIVFFDILPAENEWEVAPQMPAWSFNGFNPSVNVISSLLTFPDATVAYRIIDGNGNYIGKNGKAITDGGTDYLELIAEGNVIDVDSDAYAAFGKVLNLLKPGTYRLVSEVSAYENGNVNGFSTEAAQFAQLIVNKANNRWTETPNVIRWTWGEYNQTKNLLTAASLYPMDIDGKAFDYGTTPSVVYSILDKDKNPISGLTGFSVVNTAIAGLLSELPAGSYYLRTSLAATDYYEKIEESDLRFDIAQAVNTWTTTPNVIRWTWGSYDKEKNLITAEAKFNDFVSGLDGETQSAPAVRFTVLDSNFVAQTGLINFTATDGVVSAEVAALLAKLDAGTYYLVASLEGRHNYSAINASALIRDDAAYDFSDKAYNKTLQSVQFDVLPANNTWDTKPVMTNWQYMRFNSATNFVGGVPHYPETGKQVKYGIFESKPENATAFASCEYVFTDALTEDIITYLSGLGVGTYWLAAYAEGNGNFTPLFEASSFDVTPTRTNAWNPEPSIKDWTYGEFSADADKVGNFVTEGVAELGTVQYALQKRSGNSYSDISGCTELDFDGLVTALGTLGYGNYKLIAKTVENDNYAQAPTKELYFAVAKAENEWATGCVPTIEGWTFGSTPKSVTTASGGAPAAKYDNENVVITYTYYNARQVNGAWSADIALGEVDIDDTTPAGTYALVATATGSSNYNDLTHTAIFEIAKKANGWVSGKNPEGTLAWIWGTAESYLADKAFTVAQAISGGAVEYAIRTANGTRTFAQSEILGELKKLGVNSYEITVSVNGGDNYTNLSKVCYVTVSAADFVWSPEPASSTWQWGVADDDKVFTKPDVTVNEGDEYAIKYTVVNENNSTLVSAETDFNVVLAALRGYGVGKYTVTVTAECANYTTDTKKVTVEITPASFVWDTEVESTDWVWNGNDNTGKSLTKPVAHDINEVQLSFVYTVKKEGASDKEYVDFDELKAYLFGENAGFYTVVVSVGESEAYDADNYAEFGAQFTVEIKPTENAWKTNEPETRLFKVYDETLTISLATAEFGTVVYTEENGTVIPDINAWIANKTAPRDDAYKFVVKVAADAHGNYEELRADVSLFVTGKISVWYNADDLNGEFADYEFTYGKTLAADMQTIVLPKKPQSPADNTGAIQFEISYKKYNEPEYTGTPAVYYDEGKVYAYLKDASRHAGSYKIVVTYTPGDLNKYTKLVYTVNVLVKRAELRYDDDSLPVSEYIEAYQHVNIPTPTAGDFTDKIEISITSGKNSYPIPTGSTLSDFAKTLSVGTYNVSIRIKDTDDYFGLDTPVTSRLIIGAAVNDWTEASKAFLQKEWELYRVTEGGNQDAAYTLKIPQALYGTVECYVGKASITATDANLNAYLKAQLAGTYTVRFVVATPDPANYNGITYECSVTIKKNVNEWKEGKDPEAVYNWTGSAQVGEFKIPEAEYSKSNGLLRFDIVKLGGGYDPQYSLDVFAFKAELANLTSGGYTVTVRIGGDCSDDESEAVKEAFDEYNDNYEILSGRTEISITLGNNTVSFSSTPWDYDTEPTVTKPVATYGADTVTYTLHIGNANEEIKASEDNSAYQNLIARLKELPAGTYSVTASIDATTTYDSASATISITVNRADNGWTKHVGDNETRTWTYGASDNAEIDFVAAHVEEGKGVTIRVNGSPISSINELKSLGAGTYSIVASVPQLTNYNALTETITLTVERAQNGWFSDEDNTYSLQIATSWNWDNGNGAIVTGFVAPVPNYGDSVIVTVNRAAGDLVFTVTLRYDGVDCTLKTAIEAQVEALVRKLQALDAGSYTITAQIPRDDDGHYETYTQNAKAFTVNQAKNYWDTKPQIPNNGWSYDGNTVYPTAVPHYGEAASVVFTYASAYDEEGNKIPFDSIKNDASKWSKNQPATEGKYYVRGTLAGTVNYTALDDYDEYSIGAGVNAWVDSPSVIVWNWNDFDISVNKFSGSARSNGKVTFGIQVQGTSGYRALTIYDFKPSGEGITVDGSWVTELSAFSYDENNDGFVSAQIALMLNALKPQKYVLRVSVDGGASLAGINNYDSPYPFEIGKTSNAWVTAPAVVSYDYKTVGSSLTLGVAKYGTVSYRIIGTPNGATQEYNETCTNQNLARKLAALNAGSYTLYAWVVGDDYTANFYEDSVTSAYRVSFNVNRLANAWVANTEPDAVSIDYIDLHAGGASISNIFAVMPQSVNDDSNSAVAFALRNDKGGHVDTSKQSYTYDELFAAILALDSGSYSIEIYFDQTTNYTALTKTIALSINRRNNSWVGGLPETLATGTWDRDEEENSSCIFAENAWQTVAATHGTDGIEFTVGTDSTKLSYGVLQANAVGWNAGTYTVYVTVPESNEYNVLSGTSKIVIEKANNSWSQAYSVAGSIKDSANKVVTNWTWGDKVTFDCVKPTYGTQVTVSVTLNSNVLVYITIDYTASETAINLALQSVGSALSALGASNDRYELVLTVTEAPNWNALTESVRFTVNKVMNNVWVSAPAINDANWTYGGSVPTPTAQAKFGNDTIVFAWAVRKPGEPAASVAASAWTNWSETVPVSAGDYWLRATVADSTDYSGLVEYDEFTIRAGENVWTDAPGVNGWDWNEFSQANNVFHGSARSGGKVTFGVYLTAASADDKTELTADNFYAYGGVTLPDIGKLKSFTEVDGDIETLLKALKPGTYYVVGSAVAGGNYGELAFGATPFTVGTAANEWTVRPSAYSYTYKGFESVLAWIQPVSKYGIPVFTVKKGEEVIVGYSGLTAAELKAKLKDANAQLASGEYRLYVSVAANAEDTITYYKSIDETSVAFNVNQISAVWTTAPASVYNKTHLELQSITENFILKGTGVSSSAENPGVSFTFTASDTNRKETATLSDFIDVVKALKPGTYTVLTAYGETTNYSAVPAASTTLTISRISVGLTGLPVGNTVQGTWKEDGNIYTVNGNAYGFDGIALDYGTSAPSGDLLALVYKIDGVAETDYLTKISKLSRGTHTLEISATRTDDYELTTVSINIDIAKAQNDFVTPDGDKWDINANFTQNDTPIVPEASQNPNEDKTVSWEWNSNVQLQLTGAKFWNQIVVDILDDNGANVKHITITKSNVASRSARANDSVIDEEIAAVINSALKNLTVGSYKVVVSTASTDNWEEAVASVNVKVEPAENGWDVAPKFKGDGDKLTSSSGVYKWQYGYTPEVEAAAKWGDYGVTYYNKTTKKTFTTMPTDVGEYEARFSVAADPDRYAGISDTVVNFNIELADLETKFVGTPSIVSWIWNEFDQKVNLIKATSASGGDVKFDIINKATKAVVVANITTNADNEVDDAFVSLLNGIDAGTYTLVIKVAETDNYNAYETSDIDFTVIRATNGWDVSPRIIPWSQNVKYNPDENRPTAVAKYGEVRLTVTFKADPTKKYYEAIIVNGGKDSDDNTIALVTEILRNLSSCAPGWYVIHAEVSDDSPNYTGLSEDLDFQVFISGSDSTVKNYWTTPVSMTGWTANVGSDGIPVIYNMPVGDSYMGKIKYEVYYSKKVNGITQIDETRKVSNFDGFMIPEDDYVFAYYLPIEPGTYYLKAEAIYYKAGTLDPDENLCLPPIEPVRFDIEHRANTFTSEPQIDKDWYLGNRANWVQPTATFSEGTVSFAYRQLNDEGEEIGYVFTEMPSAPGKYVLIATGSARFSIDEVRKYKFNVYLSQNGWVTAPTIESWTLEFAPNDPTGKAQVGDVKFEYATAANPEERFSEKPTTEGEYILYASVEMDGYATLDSTPYSFTIGGAYNMTLLIIDIVLGFIVCALAIGVIIVAIRRYREC